MLYSIRIGSLAYVTMIINNDFSLLSTWFDHNKLLATDEKTRALPVGKCKYDYSLVVSGSNDVTPNSTVFFLTFLRVIL